LGIFSSNNKNKLFILLSVAIGGLIILLVLIKLFSSPPAKNIQLVYWGLWEEKEVYDPLIAEFEQKNPTIKISYQKMYHQDYLNKLLTRSRDNKGPDIFRFHNTWLPLLKEIAAPLPKNIMSNSEFEKTFYPIHQSDLKIGNYYYGLPLEIDGLVLICNQDMFNKAGMETNVVSLDDFMDAAKKLTTKTRSGQLITSGVALGLAGNIEHFSDTLGLMFLQNGVEYKVNTTKGSDSLENYLKFAAGLTSQEAAGALETYRKFAEQPNALWDDSMPNSIEAFIQEKVAMIIAPSWEVITIKNSKPELKIKVLPIYTVPGNKPISIANYWVEGVSKKSRNQTAAWLFLRFLIEKENLIKLYENQAKLRLFGEPYSRVDLADKLIQNEYVGAVIKQANNFVSLPVVSRVFDNNFNDEIVKYLENAVNSTVNGGSYTEAMKTAQAGITQVLEKIK
jgi:multiple sugar transport system substrate-binding protein